MQKGLGSCIYGLVIRKRICLVGLINNMTAEDKVGEENPILTQFSSIGLDEAVVIGSAYFKNSLRVVEWLKGNFGEDGNITPELVEKILSERQEQEG
jgi:hypothetical protein